MNPGNAINLQHHAVLLQLQLQLPLPLCGEVLDMALVESQWDEPGQSGRNGDRPGG